MNLNELIKDVAEAAKEEVAYELPAVQLLDYLTSLEEAGRVYDRLAAPLGYLPEEAPGWWELVEDARNRLVGKALERPAFERMLRSLRSRSTKTYTGKKELFRRHALYVRTAESLLTAASEAYPAIAAYLDDPELLKEAQATATAFLFQAESWLTKAESL